MKFHAREWTVASGVIVLAVFLGSALVTYLNTRALVADQQWVSHTLEVLARLEGLWAKVAEAESAERGYLVTGDAAYLEPYQNALKSIPADLHDLRGYTSDNPRQRENVDELQASITAKMTEIRLVLDLRQRYGPAAARREVLTQTGRMEMADVRAIVQRMVERENGLLEERTTRTQGTARRTLLAAILSNGIGVVLVALVAVMTLRSVTERLGAAQRLAESEEHLQLALRSANAWSWQYDVPSGQMMRSRDISTLLGLSPGSIGPTLESSLARYHPQDAERFRRELGAAIETGSEFDVELRVIWPDGSVHWFDVRGRAVYDEHHRPVHVVGIDIEVTDRKREEEVLRETEKLASAGRLAATLAHEINNPLEAVNSIHYLLLRHGKLDAEARQQLEVAHEEMGRAIEVIRNTLGLYRDAAVPLHVELSQVVENVLALFDRTLRVKGIEVHRRFESDGRVFGYRGEIRQVFINLVSNALDAMQPGGKLFIRISDGVSWRNGQRHGVRATVGDTGPGIPLEVRRRLFRPFFSTKGEKGTGLGLWVSKQLVEKHGGTIQLWSRTDGAHGTWFSVFLPYAEEGASLSRR